MISAGLFGTVRPNWVAVGLQEFASYESWDVVDVTDKFFQAEIMSDKHGFSDFRGKDKMLFGCPHLRLCPNVFQSDHGSLGHGLAHQQAGDDSSPAHAGRRNARGAVAN